MQTPQCCHGCYNNRNYDTNRPSCLKIHIQTQNYLKYTHTKFDRKIYNINKMLDIFRELLVRPSYMNYGKLLF